MGSWIISCARESLVWLGVSFDTSTKWERCRIYRLVKCEKAFEHEEIFDVSRFCRLLSALSFYKIG